MSVENLSVSINEKKIINDINFSIKSGSITAILCSNNGGKSTLIKTLSGIIYSDSGKIVVNNLLLNKSNFKKIIRQISTILEDIDNQFICEKVQSELEYPLINLNYNKEEIEKIIQKVSNITKISTILGKNNFELSLFEKIKVLISTSIVHKPSILFIDDIFRSLKLNEKKEIRKILENINSEFGTSILFTTSDVNDVIGLDNIILINNGSIVMQDTFNNIIYKDNELSKMGFKIPLMIDLSRKLQFYNLVDKIYYDPDKVVDKLWN